MSDVLDELERKLKQKAYSAKLLYADLKWTRGQLKGKWVRLEDVKAILQQLKQNYIVIEKEKLQKIYDNLRVDKISGYYVDSEFFKLIKELLKDEKMR